MPSTRDRSNIAPPEAWPPLVRFVQLARKPLERFLRIEAASGILLLLAAAAALVWANSPWAASYEALWHTPLGVRIGGFSFERSLEWAVNDGLMVIFFFVVGLEIRRELHHGELREWRRAALPAAAALGGMVAPALLYLAVTSSAPGTHSGWGVPMATDIAFAVGVLTLLGKRAPPALRVLLLTLAVMDDIGAIVVIALFYSSSLALGGLLVAAFGLLGTFVMQRLGVRAPKAYIAPGLITWAGIASSGIHPTIAGVVVGLMTPVRAWLGPDGFLDQTSGELVALSRAASEGASTRELADALKQLDFARREVLSPAELLIERLHPWVAFAIMPIFALANAGVPLGETGFDASALRVMAGVGIGLLLGKPLGVLLATWSMIKLRIGALPVGIGVRHLLVLGTVAGVGFTMALFIARLAFVDPNLLAAAKLGVLAASGGAGVLALVCGRAVLRPSIAPPATEQTADEAETSTLA